MFTAPLPLRAFRRLTRNLHHRIDLSYLHWNLRHVGLAQAGGIMSYTTPQELEALFHLAEDLAPNSHALEIGSHLGASTCFIGAGLAQKDGHLYCVDTWQNETMPEGEQDTFQTFKRNTAALNGVLTPIRKRSDQLTAAELKTPLQFAFLDVDHSYEATRRDFDLVEPWMAPEGIIAFHDCRYFQGVSRVIGEVLSKGQWSVAGIVQNLMWVKRARWKG
jgi:predicted O-methyltransferase YrrM